MFGRRQVRTHNDMMREEFSEGMDHLRMAGAHAAGSVAEMIAPGVDVMRERMIEPAIDKSVDMARDGARRAGAVARRATGRKPTTTTRRWPRMIGGLMIAGAALGAVSALLSRRRQRKWSEYESTGTGVMEETRSIAESARSAASSAAETAKEKTSDVMSQMKEATDTSPASGAKAVEPQTSVTPASSGTQPSVTPPSTTGTSESFTSGSTSSGSRNGRP